MMRSLRNVGTLNRENAIIIAVAMVLITSPVQELRQQFAALGYRSYINMYCGSSTSSSLEVLLPQHISLILSQPQSCELLPQFLHWASDKNHRYRDDEEVSLWSYRTKKRLIKTMDKK